MFNNFLYWLKKNYPGATLDVITYDVASDYIAARANGAVIPNGERKFTRKMSEQASPWTLRTERDYLSGLFKDAVRRGIASINPFADIKVKKPTSDQIRAAHHILKTEESVRLVEAAYELDSTARSVGNASFGNIVFFFLRTGLRDDELRKLEWTDIDLHEGLMSIREKHVVETRTGIIPEKNIPKFTRLLRSKSDNDLVFTRSSDYRGVHLFIQKPEYLAQLTCGCVDLENRTITFTTEYKWKPKATNGFVPICQSIRELLIRLQKKRNGNSSFVFAHHDGGSCRLKLLEMLKKAQKAAGINGRLRTHDLRHTCAATLRARGAPLETIMGILRHADIRETLLYAPYLPAEGLKAIQLLDD